MITDAQYERQAAALRATWQDLKRPSEVVDVETPTRGPVTHDFRQWEAGRWTCHFWSRTFDPLPSGELRTINFVSGDAPHVAVGDFILRDDGDGQLTYRVLTIARRPRDGYFHAFIAYLVLDPSEQRLPDE